MGGERRGGEVLLDPVVQLARGRALLSNPGDVPVDDIREFIDRSNVREEERVAAENKADEVKRRSLLIASIIAFCVACISLYEYFDASHQLTRADQALAASINNDLGFEPNAALGARQRRALWKLAMSTQAVKDEYVSILSENPEVAARVSPGFSKVSRALGLGGPNSEQVKHLIAAARRQLNNPGDHKRVFDDIIADIDASSREMFATYLTVPNVSNAKDSYERQRLENETQEKLLFIKMMEERLAKKTLDSSSKKCIRQATLTFSQSYSQFLELSFLFLPKSRGPTRSMR
jgi:hypothetical protein